MQVERRTIAGLGAMLGAVLMLGGCGPQTPEEVRAAAIGKCERQFGQMAPDPSAGTQLCACLVDRLAAEGLEITDMMGGDRSQVEGIARSCAGAAGVSLPTG